MASRSSVGPPETSKGQQLFWGNRDPDADRDNLPQVEQQHKRFLLRLERSGFNWLVFLVAASGFFTDSYNLFASNVILPALAYVYWDGTDNNRALGFNLATLGASAVGQLVFGVLADMFGRRSLYGIELIIVIFSTIGLLQCSPGYVETGNTGGNEQSTWNITGWIIFWRVVMGFGIGAEYPLSACIAAEWSSTKSRGRMMSAVFAMQPLGQLCAYAAGLTALSCFGNTKLDIDKLWRYVIGIGALPTLLALGFRIYMPESGRYTYEVRKNDGKAELDTNKVFTEGSHPQHQSSDILSPDVPERVLSQFQGREVWNYLFEQGNWVYLIGTSLCWLLLDFAFYGLGFNNPATLAKIWSSQSLDFPPDAPWWLKTSDVPNSTMAGSQATTGANPLIHEVLKHNMLHAIYTVSIPSIVGSLLIIACINHFDRRRMLTWTFGILGIVLVVAAASFRSLFHQSGLHIILIMFWVIISFLFSFGPNTLTFIIPAEVFPTRYRCTFYGVAAASGKIGAVLVQVILLVHSNIGEPDSTDIRWLLLGFALCMLLGALVAHYTIPEVQERKIKPRFEDKPLEELPPPPPRMPWKRRKGLLEVADQINDG